MDLKYFIYHWVNKTTEKTTKHWQQPQTSAQINYLNVLSREGQTGDKRSMVTHQQRYQNVWAGVILSLCHHCTVCTSGGTVLSGSVSCMQQQFWGHECELSVLLSALFSPVASHSCTVQPALNLSYSCILMPA